MSILLVNDLIEFNGEHKSRLRVLWIGGNNVHAIVIDPDDPVAFPYALKYEDLLEELRGGQAALLKVDPYRPRFILESQIPESHKQKRNRAWEIIQGLAENEPAIFEKSRRGKLVAERIALSGVTKAYIYRYLRRYWQHGKTPNALLPSYDKSGGKGQRRTAQSGVRLGRPPEHKVEPGRTINESILKIFRIAVERHYIGNEKHSLRSAYDQMISDFFVELQPNPYSAGEVATPKEVDGEFGHPTFRQFEYWYDKEFHEFDVKRRRRGNITYDKSMRGLPGTANDGQWGPGSRFQIDATIADVYLVSRIDRNRIAGRPVIYFVVDTYSRMITGFYVGWTNASWAGAMMALANTASDKVAVCRKYGIDISPEDWPCHHLPASLLGDRAEMLGEHINTLANTYNIRIDNAASMRPDWKSVVERRFRLIPAAIKAHIPGYIQEDFRERGGRDYRLDGKLDIDQFTRIIIHTILLYNNSHELENYDKDKGLAADLVPAIPIEIWNWGIANRTGRLREYAEDEVRFRLMPVEQASVTENGIKFKGRYYISSRLLAEKWLDRARQHGRWKVTISHDPRDSSAIFLHDTTSSSGYDLCAITSRSRADTNLSDWEMEQQRSLELRQRSERDLKTRLAKADLNRKITEIVDEAEAMTPATTVESARSRVKSIRRNRAEERQVDAQRESFTNMREPASGQQSAKVVPLQRTPNSLESFDIDDILAAAERKKDSDGGDTG